MTYKTLLLTLLFSQGLFFGGLPIFLQLLFYLNPWVIMVAWVCIVVSVLMIVLLVRGETIKLPRLYWQVAISGYSFSLLVLLFFRPEGQEYSYNIIPFSTISTYLTGDSNWLVSFYNLGANVGLFIPFGLYLLSRKGKKMTGIPKFFIPFFSISIIEICQYVFQRGSLDIDDLILNLIGVYLGYLLYRWFVKVIDIIPAKRST
ncbi:VanZ family protein [Peribacillus sp. NPDC097206]|uniref:VanZ family protein n=1 Tax=unclassified Peribacillus TaxID=2675266 RepID=UPI00380BC716